MMIFKSLLVVVHLNEISLIYGCGQASFGQEKNVKFTMSGFNLPAAMAYSEKVGATSLAPNISTTRQNAETFVRNWIMRSVEEVLYQQGRSAGLSDDVISLILQQLTVNTTYNPLKCDDVNTNPTGPNFGMAGVNTCIIVSDTVISTCMVMNMCQLPMHMDQHKVIDPQHLSISGSITTSNIVMVSWSNQMWQNVFNRVLRNIASGPLGSHFYGASVVIS